MKEYEQWYNGAHRATELQVANTQPWRPFPSLYTYPSLPLHSAVSGRGWAMRTIGQLDIMPTLRFLVVVGARVLSGASLASGTVRVFQKEAVYGLTEIYRAQVKDARLVSGCPASEGRQVREWVPCEGGGSTQRGASRSLCTASTSSMEMPKAWLNNGHEKEATGPCAPVPWGVQVANPGCYPTSVQLPLIPLLQVRHCTCCSLPKASVPHRGPLHFEPKRLRASSWALTTLRSQGS